MKYVQNTATENHGRLHLVAFLFQLDLVFSCTYNICLSISHSIATIRVKIQFSMHSWIHIYWRCYGKRSFSNSTVFSLHFSSIFWYGMALPCNLHLVLCLIMIIMFQQCLIGVRVILIQSKSFRMMVTYGRSIIQLVNCYNMCVLIFVVRILSRFHMDWKRKPDQLTKWFQCECMRYFDWRKKNSSPLFESKSFGKLCAVRIFFFYSISSLCRFFVFLLLCACVSVCVCHETSIMTN